MGKENIFLSYPGWEVVRKLGEGSFGGVYEIQRTLPDGTVERAALKKLTVPKDPGEIAELYAQSYDNASITAHFKEQMQDLVQEYSFMQELGENPNVVHCQDLRTIQHEDGIGWDIYIRMELLKPLKIWLSDRYDERRVIRLGLNMCSALNGCHQRNIIHRDIKPENILVTEDGRFKLGDFGIAKVCDKTATGTLTGTYSYMAPEIANRQHYGVSADIYSLGLVMYWMMNERKLPFLPLDRKIPNGEQRQEAQDRRFSGEPIPAPVNGSLELSRIVLKACAFDPKERYHSVQELAEDLKWHYQNLRSGSVLNLNPARKSSGVGLPENDPGEPTTESEETYVPSKPANPTKKEGKLLRTIGIAGISVLLIAAAGLGISKFASAPKEQLAAEETIAGTISVPETAPSTADIPVAYTYEKNNTGITITGYEGDLPAQVEIPSEIDGLPVTGIGDRAFVQSGSLVSITIPDGVTSIGFQAFAECTGLNSISIPDGVIAIDEYTFQGCSNLSSVVIPQSVTSIENSAFLGCISLDNITIPENVTSIGFKAFAGCSGLSSVTILNGVTSIDGYAFQGCTNLSSVAIPYSVTRIGNGAFIGCTSLESVIVNHNCTIGANAFPETCFIQMTYAYTYEKNASGITITRCEEILPADVEIPAEIDGLPVTSIGKQVFAGRDMKSVVIPEGVTSIGAYAFAGCTSLTSITIPDSVFSIGEYAFQSCISLESVTIPDSVTSIKEYAFAKCTSLNNVIIPDSITAISNNTFSQCTSLSSITMPKSVSRIGASAFEGCTSLGQIAIPTSVIWIDTAAFAGCTGLRSISIPDGVANINDFTFRGCTSLRSVTIQYSLSSIGDGAFEGCTSLSSVTIGRNCTVAASAFPETCQVHYY